MAKISTWEKIRKNLTGSYSDKLLLELAIEARQAQEEEALWKRNLQKLAAEQKAAATKAAKPKAPAKKAAPKAPAKKTTTTSKKQAPKKK